MNNIDWENPKPFDFKAYQEAFGGYNKRMKTIALAEDIFSRAAARYLVMPRPGIVIEDADESLRTIALSALAASMVFGEMEETWKASAKAEAADMGQGEGDGDRDSEDRQDV